MMKIYEKIGAHEGPKFQKKNDDEQIKAHRKRKKKKIAMSQNNKLGKRDQTKEY